MFGWLAGLQNAAAVTLASWFVLDACTGYLARVTPKEDGSEEPEPASSSIQFSGSCHWQIFPVKNQNFQQNFPEQYVGYPLVN